MIRPLQTCHRIIIAMRVLAIALLAALRHQVGHQPRYAAHAFLSPALSRHPQSAPARWYQNSHPSLLSSTAADIEQGADETTANESSLPSSNNSHDVVLVRRNKQSMAFRNGSPLVFSGAIESTFSLGGGSSSTSTLQMGSLVMVSVSPKKDGGDNKNKSGKDRRRGGRGGRGGGGGGRGGDAARAEIPHQIINDDKSDEAQMIKQAQDIGVGVYNPSSMYRVRILCHGSSHGALLKKVKAAMKDNANDKEAAEREAVALILQTKLHESIQARLSLNLPSDSTDSYRLVNGEGDGLSGFAVDVLGGKVAVVMSSAAWVEIHKDTILETLDAVLKEHPLYSEQGGLEIVWRNTPSRLKQDGYELSEADGDESDNDECVIVTESGVKYHTYPFGSSQKTGFYCDQRDNRLDVAKLCDGKRVLDLCCYNGGFALNAMVHGGASSCTGVDSSQDAIDAAIANAELNGLDDSRIQFLRDDIAQYMKDANDDAKEYDVIVLDPPKLAPSVSGLERASRKYHALNRDAMKIIDRKEGGLLLTCTCSGAMTQKDGGNFFLQTVQNAALAAGRQVTLLRKSGAAPCHTQSPASYPAGNYLTAALFHVSPETK